MVKMASEETKKKRVKLVKEIIKIGVIAALILAGLILLWSTTLALPALDNFEERKVAQSTKILDRTGEIVLFDIHGDIKRTIVPLEEISEHMIEATVAVEDKGFYEHNGVQFSAIVRAIWNNIKGGNLLGGQGGSTITQQVIKNALLTTDKKVSRKIKEWVLAPRLEQVLTKDEILEIYLNEVPYGGTVYGAEEASLRFFGKQAKDLNLAESAYLAALPQAPTFYSPYGNNFDALEARKNHVLDQMLVAGYITETEMNEAKVASVDFQKQEEFGIKAPHFVFYVREQLEQEYGKDVVEEGGLRVITSLDWELQEKAEEIVKNHVIGTEDSEGIATRYNAENGSIVATDPNTGEVLVMVGSRDYFDEEIDGNFNIATAERQPGSSFKPFVYAEAFNKGYKPQTVVFDLSTEFSATCVNGGDCYSPVNYDNSFRGPMSLRDALAQSVNIPAVKALYLAGLRDSLNLAKNMGIDTLTNVDQYGLTLVLGGGEVEPLDMASAYGVFAAEGVKHEQKTIIRIEDNEGNVLFEEEEEKQPERVLSENTARMISDVLSDNVARAPTFGTASPLYFPGHSVAAKTGTTNDYRDTWIVGYTPNISVAAWAGNNDNSPMERKTAGFIVSPMWNEFMDFALENRSHGSFNSYTETETTKAVINGFWKGEEIDLVGDEGEEQVVITGGGGGIHSILHWVDKSNPLGPPPSNPNSDPQYVQWEKSVQDWINRQGISDDFEVTDLDDVESIELTVSSPVDGNSYLNDSPLVVIVRMSDGRQIVSGSVSVNGIVIGNIDSISRSYSFVPSETPEVQSNNTLFVTVKDSLGNEFSKTLSFSII